MLLILPLLPHGIAHVPSELASYMQKYLKRTHQFLCQPTPKVPCVFLGKTHFPASSQKFPRGPRTGHNQNQNFVVEDCPFRAGLSTPSICQGGPSPPSCGLGRKGGAYNFNNFLQKFTLLKTYKMPSIFCAFNSMETCQGAESKTSTSFIPMLKQAMIQCGSFSRNNGAMIRPFRAKGNGANGMP
jgi:hypothetical protein